MIETDNAIKTETTLKKMTILETEDAITFIKRDFQDKLAKKLDLVRVSSSLFLKKNSGFQDNLNGIEKPVSFEVKETSDKYEIIHSLAKWKRYALYKYAIRENKGLYTDMNAIRPDEEDLRSNIHSIYVDQWDWEQRIGVNDRNLDFLRNIVNKIYNVIKKIEKDIELRYNIKKVLPNRIEFIHAEELLQQFPKLTSKEREDKICEKFGAVFIIGIGKALSNGKPHDGRAPDYDDWITLNKDGFYGLNGDILVWNPVIKRAFELSSMGIRVNKNSLMKQLKLRNSEDRLEQHWHKMLIDGKYPLSIGGGIGQSRLCMFYLRKHHIGEVQVSIWPDDVIADCKHKGIRLL